MTRLPTYLYAVATNDEGVRQAAWAALTPDEQELIAEYNAAIEAHAMANAGLLADLTDAIYGKGTAETRGYPRGMVAKVRRVFRWIRRANRDLREPSSAHMRQLRDYLLPLLSEVAP